MIKKNAKNLRLDRPKGFTLLEILIATGTFMIVMVVAVGIFTLNVGSSSTTEQMRINAQSARFAFESISREIRLAHGLVYAPVQATQSLTVNSKIVIPPFDIVPQNSSAEDKVIRIYQATAVGKNSSGQSTYKLSRRLYCLQPMARFSDSKQLVVMTQKAYESDPQTVGALYDKVIKLSSGSLAGLEGLAWKPETANCQSGSIAGEPVTPKDLATNQFKIIRSYEYIRPNDGLELAKMKLQPFIELDLTVSNPRYNQNRDDGQKIKTTLRTMIVPRNFISPYDIGQVGVEGATQ